MSWRKVKLGTVLKQLKIIVQIDNSTEYKLITVSNKGEVRLRQIVKGTEISSNKAFKAVSGKFIYSRLSIHNGAFGIIPDELDNAIVTSEMPIFECSDNLMIEFLIYSMNLQSFKFQLEKLTRGVGRTRVKESSFLNLDIELPSYDVQNQIVRHLNQVKQIKRGIDEEINTQFYEINKLRQAFLREAIQGKLTEKWRKENPNIESAKELLIRIKAEKEELVKEGKIKKEKPLPPIKEDEVPFEIPDSWVWCRLGEISNLITSGSRNWNQYYSNEGALFIRAQNIKDDRLDLTNQAFVKLPNSIEGQRTEVQFNDILITITGGNVTQTALVDKISFEEGYVSQHIALIRLSNTSIADWIYLGLICEGLGRGQLKRMIYGDKPALNLNQIQNVLIPLPPSKEQKTIITNVQKIINICDALELHTTNSKCQSELLLQVALKEALEPMNSLSKS